MTKTKRLTQEQLIKKIYAALRSPSRWTVADFIYRLTPSEALAVAVFVVEKVMKEMESSGHE